MTNLISWEVDEATTILEKSIKSWSPEEHYKIEFIHHDIISKLLMMIEGLCVVLLTLLKKRSKLVRRLSCYKSNPVIDLEEKLKQSTERSKDKEIMSKLLCLPNLKLIKSIDDNEKKFLSNIFSQTRNHWYNVLRGLIKFNLHNSISYNKFKHGLLLLPGFKLEKNQMRIDLS